MSDPYVVADYWEVDYAEGDICPSEVELTACIDDLEFTACDNITYEYGACVTVQEYNAC